MSPSWMVLDMAFGVFNVSVVLGSLGLCVPKVLVSPLGNVTWIVPY